jgi:hypothetical protein
MQLFIFFLFFHYTTLHYTTLQPEDGCMKPKHVVEEEEENK